MNTHEYEAKQILKRYHIPIPEFEVASKNHDIEQIIKHLKLKEAVVKIQVHAGGRGKASDDSLRREVSIDYRGLTPILLFVVN
jgi:succinyl-CoA synthetase beta subunit